MRRWRAVVGVILTIVALCGFFFWELRGREELLMREVLVAQEDIAAGEKCSADLFKTVKLPRETLLADGLSAAELPRFEGKVSTVRILKHSQISASYFRQDPFSLKEGEAVFPLKPEWISMRSSALRRGDLVDLYGTGASGLIGTYRIAFVKDDAEREIRDAGTGEVPLIKQDVLDRTDSTSTISHIEIMATVDEYQHILSYVEGESPNFLMIVQRRDFLDF